MVRLYSYWRSSAAYRVRIALQLKGIEHEIVPVSLAPGVAEHRQAAYRDKNPQMLVPFMEDGDVAIGQSMAMLEYLEERYPQHPLLPDDPGGRARVRAICNIIACDIHPLQNLRVQQRVKTEHDGDGVAWARHWIDNGFRALEQLAGDGPFAVGDSVTLADCLLVPQVYNARRFELDLDAFPKLTAITDHCNEQAAFIAARPEAQPDAT